MGSSLSSFLLSIPLLLFFFLFRRLTQRADDVPLLQGPKASSWTYGNMVEFILGIPAGHIELGWFARYGAVLKFRACFGEERLLISDPLAIKYILQDPNLFVKGRTHQLINLIGFGEGNVISAHGDDHRRIRAVMNAMFSPGRVRELVPTIERIAKELSDEWAAASGSAVDAYRLLHQTTLRTITEAAIGYDSNADKEYTSHFENLMVSVSQRSKQGIVADAILSRLPLASTKILMNIPPPDLRKLLDHRIMAQKISEGLIARHQASLDTDEGTESDLFGVLVRTNAKAENGMSDAELKDQFAGIAVAGEDTTANGMAWVLYTLAQCPEWQERLRQEIRAAEWMAGTNSTSMDYDRLPFLNALIKEVLRFYSPASYTEREATSDTVLPLSTPILSAAGKKMEGVRVKKGRKIVISITGYNRSTELWGKDANVLDPSRWLDGSEATSSATIGPYANLLTFFGGPRTCLGWRLAVLETQIVVCELVRNFVFTLQDGVTIRPACAITLVPMDSEGRTRLPLLVERL